MTEKIDLQDNNSDFVPGVGEGIIYKTKDNPWSWQIGTAVSISTFPLDAIGISNSYSHVEPWDKIKQWGVLSTESNDDDD